MPLNYITLSSSINSIYEQQKNNLISNNPKQTPYPAPTSTEWMDNYILLYNADAMQGVFSLPAVVMTPNPNILRFSYLPRPTTIGTQIAAFWSGQLTPGQPQVCPAIVSVTNDAAKIGPIIDSYLLGLPGNVQNLPPYSHLFQFIESQVKTIIWTISEAGPLCATTYPVTIT